MEFQGGREQSRGNLRRWWWRVCQQLKGNQRIDFRSLANHQQKIYKESVNLVHHRKSNGKQNKEKNLKRAKNKKKHIALKGNVISPIADVSLEIMF